MLHALPEFCRVVERKNWMTKPWIVVGLACACGRAADAPVDRGKPTAPSVAPTAPSVAPTAPSRARPRTDRPPIKLGGSTTWATVGNLDAVRFCPGDRELVALDEGGVVRRFRVDDGAQLAVTPPIGAASTTRWDGEIDCGADGVALILDQDHSPALIDASGKVTKPPAPIEAERARFAPDGAVWALTPDGVTAWSGVKVSTVIPGNEHTLYSGLGDGGAYAEYVYQSGKASDDGAWMVRDGVRIRLTGGVSGIVMTAVAPDGGFAIADEMTAYGWVVKGKTAGKRMLLLDQSGTHIKAIAATNKWFVVVDAGGNILAASRPSMRWRHLDKPCGEYPNYFMAMAVAHDDKRIAVACTGVGVRLFDLQTGKPLSKDSTTSAGNIVAWSPSGAQLATLASDGPIQIWRGANLATRLADAGGTSLWWSSETELAGGKDGELTAWTIADGKAHQVAPPRHVSQPESGGYIVHSPHGEIVTAAIRIADDIDELTIVRGGSEKKLELPAGAHWIDGLAINDAGSRAVLWRGQYNGEPASQVFEIDVASGTVEVHDGACTAAAVGDDLTIIARTSGAIERRSKAGVKELGQHGGVTALAVAHDVVASGDADGAISLWSTAGGSLGTLSGATSAIRALAFTRDGTHLASTGADGTIVWDLTP